MRKTWEKIVQCVVTIYGHYISIKLQNKAKASIPNPEYTGYVKLKQKQHVKLLNLQSARLSEAKKVNKFMLTKLVEYRNSTQAHTKLALL